MIPIEQVIGQYFPNRSLDKTEQLAGGLINETSLIQLDDGAQFIVQKMNTEVFTNIKDIHQNIELVGKHLSEKDYSFGFLIPIKTGTSASFMELDDGIWRVLPFVENSYSVQKPRSVEMARNAGMCLGHFHACTQDLNSDSLRSTLPDFHSGALRIDQFEEAVWETDFTGIRLVGEISKHFHVLMDWDHVCSQIPKHVVHYDTKIENFLFKNGTEEVAAMIDLDTIMPGCRLSDVGDMIRSFCNDGSNEPRLDFREAVIQGYQSEMNEYLTEDERRFLKFSGSALTLMQSLRFLTDHLNEDVYYHTEFEGQNLERAESQFLLFQDLHS